jgi:ankyrin repeat protein
VWFGLLASPLPGYQPRTEHEHDLYFTCFRQVLQRCGPNVIYPRFRRSVLHDVAASDEALSPKEAVAFATALLDAGARTDVRDGLLNSTPLGWACRWGRVEIVELLLNSAVDPVEPDAEPWATPKAWAEKGRHEAVLSPLTRHGA